MNNNRYNNYDGSYNADGYPDAGRYGGTDASGYDEFGNYQNPSRHYMTEEERKHMMNQTMTRTFGLMFLGLLITAITSVVTIASPTLLNFIYGTSYGFYVCIFGELGIVIFLSSRLQKMRTGTAVAMFFLYAVVSGITLSTIFFACTLGTIMFAFLTASAMFGAMAIYGSVTNSSMASMGSILFMGLIGIIIASVVNIFLASSMLDMMICYIGVALFLGLTAYDTQKIKAMVAQSNSVEDTRKIAVFGALNLYLDMINIFLYILRIFGRKN